MSIQYPLISVNGVIGAQVSPLDRGFAYGDGLFETCRIFAGAIPLWEWHLERLQLGAERLMIALDNGRLIDFLTQLLKVSGVREGILKIIISRGVGGRGYRLPETTLPTYCLAIFESSPNQTNQQGIDVRICHQRLSLNPGLAGIKHLNRLEHILARAEWQDDRYAEGLLLDAAGNLIEATASNFLMVRDGQLLTPDLSLSGVAGVMRRIIIEQLAPSLSLPVQIKQLTLVDIRTADEIFLCNSVYGIWPVLSVVEESELQFPLGDVTVQLQRALKHFLQSKVSPEVKA